MDKKLFLAIGICAAIFLLWQNVYLKPLADRQALMRQTQTSTTSTTPQAPAEIKTQGIKPTAAASAKTVELGSGGYSLKISTKGGVVTTVGLQEFRGQKASSSITSLIGGSEQLDLMSPAPEWNEYLNRIVYSVKATDKTAEGHDRLVLVHDDARATIQRTYVLNSSLYSLNHDISITFKDAPPQYIFVGLRGFQNISKQLSENERREIHYKKAGGHEKWQTADIDELKEDLGEGQWIGYSSRYFLNALIDRGAAIKPQFQARPTGTGEVVASLIYRTTDRSIQIPQTFYYGPKDLDVLKNVSPNMQAAVDFGWFTIFALPMLNALNWFYKYLHNYGIAIILLTLLVKVVTYPLTLKSMKGMKEMQRIQPQMAKLREKHKDDKERLNREMLQLMKTNGYNPMSGCLPIFIQMPIFVALYNVLYGAIDLYGQPFFGWIHDLSAKDPYYVTPVLLALMMFVQQKMTPNTATDPAQQRMMMFMPVIFGIMMLWLPSGLTLYMLVNSVVSIVQQVWINRSLGLGGKAGASATA